jgi:tetratricopeptide (TPR) repeat protein
LDAAEAAYQSVLQTDSQRADAWVGIGLVHAEHGRLSEAIAAYDKGLAIDPDNQDALLNRGVAWHASGDSNQAASDYHRILELDPQDPDAARNVALVYMDDLEWEQALRYMTQAMMILPHIDSDLYRDRAECWTRIGNEAQAALDLSVAEATDALDDDPGDQEARIARASALLALGEYEFAIGDCDDVLAATPESLDALEVRADAQLALGNNDEAEVDYSRLTELEHRRTSGFVGRGLAREAKRDFTGAIEDLESALRLDPLEQGAALRLAWILATCPDDARRNGSRALELATPVCHARNWRDWVALNSYAVAAAESGKFDEAIQRQGEAIERAPPAERAAMQQRLKAFENHQPWRDEQGD